MSNVIVGTAKATVGVDLAEFVTTSRPPNPSEGLIIYNLTDQIVEVFDGTEWRQVGKKVEPSITLYNAWGFNNTATSSGTAGTTATITGATYTTTAKYGSHALSFDGSNDYARFVCPNAGNTWSAGFWIYWRGHNSGGRSYLIDFRPSGEGNSYWLLDSNNTMTYLQANGSERTISFTPIANTWEHYALVSNDGGVAKIYRNGTLIDTGTQNGDTVNGEANLGTYYGARGGSGNYFTNAIIDNFFFDTTALSASQIASIYADTNHY